jgi:hypothetical protein
MSSRNIMRIDLSGPAKKKVEALSDQHGMTQVTIMSRMVEWFTQQKPVIQNQILMAQPPEAMRRETVQRILEDMASK